MGGHFSSETPLVLCYSGRCSHAFPLRVSADAARAASAAAMGNAMVATVVGYTTKLTKEASGRVQLSQQGKKTRKNGDSERIGLVHGAIRRK